MDHTTAETNAFGDLPTRPMRIKVLYTFDTDHKTNCLARLSDTISVPAVELDDTSQVGVIDLRQCLQAITSASPELTSRLREGDFAIYAFDYSESDTPLVGQGMLSAALAGSQQSKTMITGRVCQNVPALFSNGIKETLEVKLRLVPVPKQAHHDSDRKMDGHRNMAPAMSTGFDPNAWSTSLQQTQLHQSPNDYFSLNTEGAGSQEQQALIDDLFGLGSVDSGEGREQHDLGLSETPSAPIFDSNPAFAAHSHSAPGSRAGSPIISLESSTRNAQLRHQSFSATGLHVTDQSRPGSRASIRTELAPSQHLPHPRPSSTRSFQQQENEVYYNDDGQPRKRAKVTQTDWRGRSSFASRKSDLRVTAATAASMEMHRPVPTRPGAFMNNLEPPPRVPTPVPQSGAGSRQSSRPSIGSKSLLRQASMASMDFMSDIDQMSEAVMSSPEEDSPSRSMTAEGTPQDIPSSPPVFHGMSLPQPSSPGLPTMPQSRNYDSGYMSERNTETTFLFDSFDANKEDCAVGVQDFANAQQGINHDRQSQPFIKSEGQATVGLPPAYPIDSPFENVDASAYQAIRPGRGQDLTAQAAPHLTRQESEPWIRLPRSAQSATSSRPNSPLPQLLPVQSQTLADSEAPSRRNSLALPTMPAQNSRRPAFSRQSSQRQHPNSYESEAGSPAPSDCEGRPSGPRRSGSGAPRRKVIEQRLQSAVAKGEVPQYCSHCGAIETPTWRRLYVKHVDGKPSPLDYVEGEGETIGVEITKRDESTNEATKFVIRKSMKKTKDMRPGKGFADTQLCNPCGLWFTKTRKMRPSDRWGRKSGTRRSRKEKVGQLADNTDGLEPPSDAFFTDAVVPEDITDEAGSGGAEQHESDSSQASRAQSGTSRPRSHSMEAGQSRRSSDNSQWGSSQRKAALARATRSSPVRYGGTQDSPIELDSKTPMPTRRLLFPSPRQAGVTKSLESGDLPPSKSTSPVLETATEKARSEKIIDVEAHADVSVFEAFTFEKENMPPFDTLDEDLANLFDGSPSALFKTPFKTPTKRSPRLLEKLMKTPTSGSRKRKPLTPNRSAGTNKAVVSGTANDFMTSPPSSRYFLRSTPTRLANTPSRRSQNSSGGSGSRLLQPSPFSRHLADILSNNNDGLGFGSPSQFGFGDLPTFTTPGRNIDWDMDPIMSSEFGAFGESEAGTSEEALGEETGNV